MKEFAAASVWAKEWLAHTPTPLPELSVTFQQFRHWLVL